MKLRNLRLSTRITVAALLLVTVGAIGLMFMEEARLREAYLNERRADLETAMETEKLRLRQTIDSLRKDAVFLSTSPPTSGLIRALQNHGFDTKENTTTALWKERLGQIFAAFSIAHPEYFQIRFIGVADGGRELVRIDNRNGKVGVMPEDGLQAKGDRGYFKAGLKLRASEVYLSEFDLNMDHGVIELPYKPTLRAVTPVFTPAGELFGMVVVNLEIARLLESVTLGVPSQVRAYMANMNGQYLLHAERERSFGFLLGRDERITDDFPGLAALLAANAVDHIPLQTFSLNGDVQYLAADRFYYDPHDPARFMLLAYHLPDEAVVRGITAIPPQHIVGGFLAMLLVGIMVALVLRRMFAPLKHIVVASRRVIAGERDVDIPEDGSGEIAELSHSIGEMMGKLARREKKIEEAKRELESQHHALFENMIDGYGFHRMLFRDGVAVDYVPLKINSAFERLTGLKGVEGRRISEIIPGIHESSPELLENYAHVVQTGEPRRFEIYVAALGRWFNITAYSPQPEHFVTLFYDITEHKQAERELRVAAITFEAQDAILITDKYANILRVNRAFTEITGYRQEEVSGKNPRILSSGKHDKAFYQQMWGQIIESGSWTGEVWDRRKNGEVYPKWLTITAVKNEFGEITEYVGVFMDITERKKKEEEIHNLAFYDLLTKLPNRRLLLDRFRLAQSVSARNGYFGAILFLDMDNFKLLNDTMGHDCGDQMLVEVAQRLRSCVREIDTVARFGGDEFVVLLEELGKDAGQVSQTVAAIAEKIRVALSRPYLIRDREHHSSPSIGVSLYCGTGESPDELLKHADTAMYQAKETGRNAVCFFDIEMQNAVEQHAALESDLHHAVTGGQLRLYYQVQVDNEGKPLGAEALVRWMHPVRGLVPPGHFIPVAEQSVLILEIGHWVLDEACRQLADWSGQEKMRNLTLAVNVSAQQFHLPDFVERVAAVLRVHAVEPSLLKLELTEGLVLKDIGEVVIKMHALKALGIKLSMDDFGTGYSSLSYLKQLPLDQLKIDQSFVRDIVSDASDAVMVQTIIGLARNFSLEVISEGVETEDQLAFLKLHGCGMHQGYLFSKPVPLEEFEVLIGERQGYDPMEGNAGF